MTATAANPFKTPMPVSDVQMVFPADAMRLMPACEDIPPDFTHGSNPWVKWQRQWFYHGLESFPQAKPGIDRMLAIRHLTVIQSSFEPKHEHKEAAVAYLASLWMELPEPTSHA